MISRWLASELGREAIAPFLSDRVTAWPGGSTNHFEKDRRIGSLASLKANNVCDRCNNGWMSRLDAAAKPLLLPLLHDERHVLNPGQIRLLAAWAQLKALAYDDCHRGRLLPAPLAREFTSGRQPLVEMPVGITRFVRHSEGVRLLHARERGRPRRPSGGVLPHSLSRTTFVFGALAISVHYYEGDEIIPMPAHNPFFVPLWPAPPDAEQMWPPRVAINEGVLMGLLWETASSER